MRVARICTACQTRVFGKPDWECEKHPGKTQDQPNRPYFGVPRRQFRDVAKGKKKSRSG